MKHKRGIFAVVGFWSLVGLAAWQPVVIVFGLLVGLLVVISVGLYFMVAD